MKYYLTWDIIGEFLWTTTPYRNNVTYIWESEYTTPANKIPVVEGTLEFYCWEAANAENPSCITSITEEDFYEIRQYAVT
jgi:hypothetical protein